jgi:hypothetical protein
VEDRQFEGLWWLPEQPGTTVGGVLTFSNRKPILLSLIGSLGPIESFGQPVSHSVILGVTKNSKFVTLLNCQKTGGQLSAPGYISEEYSPRTVLVGGHFQAAEEVKFHCLQVKYENLAEWIGVSGFTLAPTPDQEGKYQFSYSFPPRLTAKTTKGDVTVEYTLQQSGDRLSEMRMRQFVSLKIETGVDMGLDDWHTQFLQPIQNLLTLGMGEPTRATELIGFSPTVTSESDKGAQETPVEILYRQISERSDQRRRLAPEMLFTLSDIADVFEQTMEGWLRVAEDLDSVCNLFFGTRYAPQMYVQQRFLSMAQAAESYHRRRIRNAVLGEQDHQRRMSAVLESTPPEHRVWLQDLLAYSNEPRFAARIRELFSRTARVLDPLLPKKKKFVSTVVASRNYYTHYDTSLRDRAAHGTKLFFVAEVLSVVVQACLLAEMGISYERQVELFRRSPRYQMILDARNELE